MSTAVIALGANLEHPESQLHRAAHRIAELDGVEVIARSHLYRTAPMGGPEQPDYINAVVIATTDVEPRVLLAELHGIEAEHGRTRDVRWGPRTLDLDLIAYDDHRSSDPDLLLPHPRAHERAFVLLPWLDVDRDARLPGHGTVAALLEDLDASGCEMLPGGRVGES